MHGDIYHFIDTAFNNLKEYRKWNNAGRDLINYSPIGSMGTALNRLTFLPNNSIWDYYDFRAYDPYFTRPSEIKYYNVRSALTQANYWMGYDIGQKFEIYHTQNVNERWNFLISYKRLNDLGFYQNNRSKQANFLFGTHYKSKGDKYNVYFHFASEKLEVEENGGIAVDSIFEQNLESNRIIYNVNLSSDNRVMRNRRFFLNHELLLTRAKSDSLPDTKSKLWIGHEFNYSRKSDLYSGISNSPYYQNYFNNTDIYTDSSYYNSLQNTVYLKTTIGKNDNLMLKAGATSLNLEYGTDNFQTSDNALGIIGELIGKVSNVRLKAKLDYALTGNISETFNFKGLGTIKLFEKGQLSFGYELISKYPNLFQQANFSDNFVWLLNLRKEQTNVLSASLKWSGNNGLTVSNYTINNFTYFDSLVTPTQHGEVLNYTRIDLRQDFTFWDIIHLDNRIYYQILDAKGKEVLPIPELLTRNTLYVEFALFKKALKCVVGGEVKYFSNYNSPSYVPAIGDFVVRNERTIGNYPLIDVFANVKIRKATVFLKYEHVNQGLQSYTYYAAPHYPFPDRIFRVGISWRFFN